MIVNVIGIVLLVYSTYAVACYFISIIKYRAQIVWHPTWHMLKSNNGYWTMGDDIWVIPMIIVVLLFNLGLTLCNYFGLIQPGSGW